MKKERYSEKTAVLRKLGASAIGKWLMSKPLLRDFLSGINRMLKGHAGVYIVGGIVRDIIIGRKGSHDVDIMAADTTFEEIEAILMAMKKIKKYGIKDVISAGKSFPVFKVSVKWNKEPLDIALARTERSTGNGHREFITNSESISAMEDSRRRDFTANAIFYRIRSARNNMPGNLIDFHGGIGDIVRKSIKAVGNPEDRFREDPLRMMRAVRQKNQLGFSIEADTWKSICRLVPELIKTVSPERISVELMKALEANPPQAFSDFTSCMMTETLIPELSGLFEKTLERLMFIRQGAPHHLISACLLSEAALCSIREKLKRSENGPYASKKQDPSEPDFYSPDTAYKAAKRLCLPGLKQTDYLLYSACIFANLRRISNPAAIFDETMHYTLLSDEIMELLRIIRKTDSECLHNPDSMLEKSAAHPVAVSGGDIAKEKIAQGPAMKSVIRHIRQFQLDRGTDDRDVLIEEGRRFAESL